MSPIDRILLWDRTERCVALNQYTHHILDSLSNHLGACLLYFDTRCSLVGLTFRRDSIACEATKILWSKTKPIRHQRCWWSLLALAMLASLTLFRWGLRQDTHLSLLWTHIFNYVISPSYLNLGAWAFIGVDGKRHRPLPNRVGLCE